MNQIQIHNKIDNLASDKTLGLDAADIRNIIESNSDAKQYFFHRVGEQWLQLLWDNGLLDNLKKKPEDANSYGYRTPEINYLIRVSEKAPKQVTSIILSIPISSEAFNPELIDAFTRIASKLPVDQLVKVVKKISEEHWVSLMSEFRQWAFEYKEMLAVLSKREEFSSVLLLAQEMLSIRAKESKQSKIRSMTSSPFCLQDLSDTGIFETLSSLKGDNAIEALRITSETIKRIVLREDKESEGVFEINDSYHLFDVDFFHLERAQKKYSSDRDDVRELAATIRKLCETLIKSNCGKSDFVRKIYQDFIATLPNSQSMWRLKLSVLALCPKSFSSELSLFFSKIFSTEYYHEYTLGTEYETALKETFSVLPEDYQRKYVQQILNYFGKAEKDSDATDMKKRSGWKILSSICDSLTKEEQAKCESTFGRACDGSYEPQPAIGEMKSGMVVPKGPVSQEDFNSLEIDKIAQNLRTIWTPKELREQNRSDDFLRPLNAEGVGNLLKNDVATRLQDYIDNSSLFFERNVLDQHYTYSFFRGIQETLQSDQHKNLKINWSDLVSLMVTIAKSGESEKLYQGTRKRDSYDSWLSNWTGVHSAIADVIQELLREKDQKTAIDVYEHRNQLLQVISYLLLYPDPLPGDEDPETATSKTKSPGMEDYVVSDPFHMAINSVRGRAFEAFTSFIYLDGKRLKDTEIKLSSDVKEVYESTLNQEKTRALMFMFGRYFAWFYFRDKQWMRSLIGKIFPEELEKKNLYTAAWEGFLSSTLYRDVFFDEAVQLLYKRGLELTPEDYPNQKHFQDPEEALPAHIALAFMHFERFGFDHPLFVAFRSSNDNKRIAELISFLGRAFVSGDNANANKLLEEEVWPKPRLEFLWNWALKEYAAKEVLTEFGFWFNANKKIFEIKWLAEHIRKTLEKTTGAIERDHELMLSIEEISREAPLDALGILRLYMLEGVVNGVNRDPIYLDKEWTSAFQILYSTPETKTGTYQLVDELIEKGGSNFWELKDALK